MTNKEWMTTLPAELLYDTIDWLIHVYGKRWNNSRAAIIDWFNKEYDPEQDMGYVKNDQVKDINELIKRLSAK